MTYDRSQGGHAWFRTPPRFGRSASAGPANRRASRVRTGRPRGVDGRARTERRRCCSQPVSRSTSGGH
eukprot:4575455-Alexandrium_andersonii.AAC.1